MPQESEPTIKIEVDLPHHLAAHLAFLANAQGVDAPTALRDLVQEDKEAWENDTRQIPRRLL
jgi:hypothetical protein